MTLTKAQNLWLELALTPGFQSVVLPPLLEKFTDIEGIFSANLLALGNTERVSASAAQALVSRAGKEAAVAEKALLEKNAIKLITYVDPLYPPLLRQISDPPAILFMKGDLTADDIFVSVVGSRRTTAYGEQVAYRLSGDLAKTGIVITSGMAYGIDQAAHNGALAAEGRTVAVLGSGFGKIYPNRSEKIVERISRNGALLTEYPFNVAPSKFTFPARNRIVSGMSYGTLVVEAAERSGALITARLTLEQNRELFAVPGPIYKSQSFGTNYLIKRGAKLVQSADDIIEELPAEIRHCLKTEKDEPEKVELDDLQKKILTVLSIDTPVHIDIIADRLGMSTADISLTLLDLEIKSVVKQLPGMEYITNLKNYG